MIFDGLRWEFVLLVVLTAAVPFIYFYWFSRFLARVLNFFLRFKYRKYQRIHIGAISFGIMTGRIYLTNFRYASKNSSFRVAHITVTFRWWLRKVRKGIDDDKQKTRKARMVVELKGMEHFIYNNSAKTDEILSVNKSSGGRMSNKEAAKSRRVHEKAEGQKELQRKKLLSETPRQLHRLPLLYRLVPVIDIGVVNGAVTLGNPRIPTMMVFTFDHGVGVHTTGEPRCQFDRYRSITRFDLENFKIRIIPNPSYLREQQFTRKPEVVVDDMLTTVNNFRSFFKDIRFGFLDEFTSMTAGLGEQAKQMRTGIGRAVFGQEDKNEIDEEREDVAELLRGVSPGRQPRKTKSAKKALSAARIEDLEALRNADVFSCSAMRVVYTTDVAGPVPTPESVRAALSTPRKESKKERKRRLKAEKQERLRARKVPMKSVVETKGESTHTSESHQSEDPLPNTATGTPGSLEPSGSPESEEICPAPFQAIDFFITQGQFRYGPWVERQRALITSFFYPPVYRNHEIQQAVPGDLRLEQECLWNFVFVDRVSMRVPFRESSEQKMENKESGKGDTDYAPSWIELSCLKKSVWSWTLPYRPVSSGVFSSFWSIDLNDVLVTTSLNDASLVLAPRLEIHWLKESPLTWNGLQLGRWVFRLHGARVFLLRYHFSFFSELLKDWALKSPAALPWMTYCDLAHFVPQKNSFEIDFINGFELFLNVNKSNIIDHHNDLSDNTFIVLRGPELHVSVSSPPSSFEADNSRIRFSLQAVNVVYHLSLPAGHPVLENMSPEDLSFASMGSLDLRGDYISHPMDSLIPDALCIHIHCSGIQVQLFGFFIRYFLFLRDNYFGFATRYMTLDEHNDIESRNWLRRTVDNVDQKNPFDFSLLLVVEHAILSLPLNLYSCDRSVDLTIRELLVEVRQTPTFLDTNVSSRLILLSVPTLDEEEPDEIDDSEWRWGGSRIEDVSYSLQFRKGPKPTMTTYSSAHKLLFGCFSVALNPVQITSVARAISHFVFHFRSRLDAFDKHIVDEERDPSVASVEVRSGAMEVDLWGRDNVTRVACPSVHVSYSSLVQKEQCQKFVCAIESIAVRSLVAARRPIGTMQRTELTWTEVASAVFSLAIQRTVASSDWEVRRDEQQSFLSVHDREERVLPDDWKGQQLGSAPSAILQQKNRDEGGDKGAKGSANGGVVEITEGVGTDTDWDLDSMKSALSGGSSWFSQASESESQGNTSDDGYVTADENFESLFDVEVPSFLDISELSELDLPITLYERLLRIQERTEDFRLGEQGGCPPLWRYRSLLRSFVQRKFGERAFEEDTMYPSRVAFARMPLNVASSQTIPPTPLTPPVLGSSAPFEEVVTLVEFTRDIDVFATPAMVEVCDELLLEFMRRTPSLEDSLDSFVSGLGGSSSGESVAVAAGAAGGVAQAGVGQHPGGETTSSVKRRTLQVITPAIHLNFMQPVYVSAHPRGYPMHKRAVEYSLSTSTVPDHLRPSAPSVARRAAQKRRGHRAMMDEACARSIEQLIPIYSIRVSVFSFSLFHTVTTSAQGLCMVSLNTQLEEVAHDANETPPVGKSTSIGANVAGIHAHVCEMKKPASGVHEDTIPYSQLKEQVAASGAVLAPNPFPVLVACDLSTLCFDMTQNERQTLVSGSINCVSGLVVQDAPCVIASLSHVFSSTISGMGSLIVEQRQLRRKQLCAVVTELMKSREFRKTCALRRVPTTKGKLPIMDVEMRWRLVWAVREHVRTLGAADRAALAQVVDSKELTFRNVENVEGSVKDVERRLFGTLDQDRKGRAFNMLASVNKFRVALIELGEEKNRVVADAVSVKVFGIFGGSRKQESEEEALIRKKAEKTERKAQRRAERDREREERERERLRKDREKEERRWKKRTRKDVEFEKKLEKELEKKKKAAQKREKAMRKKLKAAEMMEVPELVLSDAGSSMHPGDDDNNDGVIPASPSAASSLANDWIDVRFPSAAPNTVDDPFVMASAAAGPAAAAAAAQGRTPRYLSKSAPFLSLPPHARKRKPLLSESINSAHVQALHVPRPVHSSGSAYGIGMIGERMERARGSGRGLPERTDTVIDVRRTNVKSGRDAEQDEMETTIVTLFFDVSGIEADITRYLVPFVLQLRAFRSEPVSADIAVAPYAELESPKSPGNSILSAETTIAPSKDWGSPLYRPKRRFFTGTPTSAQSAARERNGDGDGDEDALRRAFGPKPKGSAGKLSAFVARRAKKNQTTLAWQSRAEITGQGRLGLLRLTMRSSTGHSLSIEVENVIMMGLARPGGRGLLSLATSAAGAARTTSLAKGPIRREGRNVHEKEREREREREKEKEKGDRLLGRSPPSRDPSGFVMVDTPSEIGDAGMDDIAGTGKENENLDLLVGSIVFHFSSAKLRFGDDASAADEDLLTVRLKSFILHHVLSGVPEAELKTGSLFETANEGPAISASTERHLGAAAAAPNAVHSRHASVSFATPGTFGGASGAVAASGLDLFKEKAKRFGLGVAEQLADAIAADSKQKEADASEGTTDAVRRSIHMTLLSFTARLPLNFSKLTQINSFAQDWIKTARLGIGSHQTGFRRPIESVPRPAWSKIPALSVVFDCQNVVMTVAPVPEFCVEYRASRALYVFNHIPPHHAQHLQSDSAKIAQSSVSFHLFPHDLRFVSFLPDHGQRLTTFTLPIVKGYLISHHTLHYTRGPVTGSGEDVRSVADLRRALKSANKTGGREQGPAPDNEMVLTAVHSALKSRCEVDKMKNRLDADMLNFLLFSFKNLQTELNAILDQLISFRKRRKMEAQLPPPMPSYRTRGAHGYSKSPAEAPSTTAGAANESEGKVLSLTTYSVTLVLKGIVVAADAPGAVLAIDSGEINGIVRNTDRADHVSWAVEDHGMLLTLESQSSRDQSKTEKEGEDESLLKPVRRPPKAPGPVEQSSETPETPESPGTLSPSQGMEERKQIDLPKRSHHSKTRTLEAVSIGRHRPHSVHDGKARARRSAHRHAHRGGIAAGANRQGAPGDARLRFDLVVRDSDPSVVDARVIAIMFSRTTAEMSPASMIGLDAIWSHYSAAYGVYSKEWRSLLGQPVKKAMDEIQPGLQKGLEQTKSLGGTVVVRIDGATLTFPFGQEGSSANVDCGTISVVLSHRVDSRDVKDRRVRHVSGVGTFSALCVSLNDGDFGSNLRVPQGKAEIRFVSAQSGNRLWSVLTSDGITAEIRPGVWKNVLLLKRTWSREADDAAHNISHQAEPLLHGPGWIRDRSSGLHRGTPADEDESDVSSPLEIQMVCRIRSGMCILAFEERSFGAEAAPAPLYDGGRLPAVSGVVPAGIELQRISIPIPALSVNGKYRGHNAGRTSALLLRRKHDIIVKADVDGLVCKVSPAILVFAFSMLEKMEGISALTESSSSSKPVPAKPHKRMEKEKEKEKEKAPAVAAPAFNLNMMVTCHLRPIKISVTCVPTSDVRLTFELGPIHVAASSSVRQGKNRFDASRIYSGSFLVERAQTAVMHPFSPSHALSVQAVNLCGSLLLSSPFEQYCTVVEHRLISLSSLNMEFCSRHFDEVVIFYAIWVKGLQRRRGEEKPVGATTLAQKKRRVESTMWRNQSHFSASEFRLKKVKINADLGQTVGNAQVKVEPLHVSYGQKRGPSVRRKGGDVWLTMKFGQCDVACEGRTNGRFFVGESFAQMRRSWEVIPTGLCSMRVSLGEIGMDVEIDFARVCRLHGERILVRLDDSPSLAQQLGKGNHVSGAVELGAIETELSTETAPAFIKIYNRVRHVLVEKRHSAFSVVEMDPNVSHSIVSTVAKSVVSADLSEGALSLATGQISILGSSIRCSVFQSLHETQWFHLSIFSYLMTLEKGIPDDVLIQRKLSIAFGPTIVSHCSAPSFDRNKLPTMPERLSADIPSTKLFEIPIGYILMRTAQEMSSERVRYRFVSEFKKRTANGAEEDGQIEITLNLDWYKKISTLVEKGLSRYRRQLETEKKSKDSTFEDYDTGKLGTANPAEDVHRSFEKVEMKFQPTLRVLGNLTPKPETVLEWFGIKDMNTIPRYVHFGVTDTLENGLGAVSAISFRIGKIWTTLYPKSEDHS